MKKEDELLKEISSMLLSIKEKKPIVHCITNYVTVNDCANSLLAINASPIMAESKKEVEEVTSFSNSLLLNIGTLNEDQVLSMILSGKKAKKMNIPIIFDPVGSSATSYRNLTSSLLLEKIKPDIIKGNFSELKALINNEQNLLCRGVDVSFEDQIDKENLSIMTKYIQNLSKKLDSIIVATGKIDIVCYKEDVYYGYNGHETLCKITGSGCMIGAIIAGFSGLYSNYEKNNLLKASVLGVTLMGLAGEKAYSICGLNSDLNIGTFHYKLFDYLCSINSDMIINEGRIYSNKKYI